MLRTHLVVDKVTTGLMVEVRSSQWRRTVFKVKEKLNFNIQCTCLPVWKAVLWMRRLVAGHLSLEDRVRSEVRPCEAVRDDFQKHMRIEF